MPDGTRIKVDEAGNPGGFHLSLECTKGVFLLTSDSITHRYLHAPVVAYVPTDQMPRDRGYTIASALLFPGLQINRQQTINQARECTLASKTGST